MDTFAVIVAFGAWLLLATLAASCAVPVDVTVGVKLDDKCLLELPSCDGPESYACGHYEDGAWTSVPGCRVACVAGRTLGCEADGPVCSQTAGDEEVGVPVVCAEEER